MGFFSAVKKIFGVKSETSENIEVKDDLQSTEVGVEGGELPSEADRASDENKTDVENLNEEFSPQASDSDSSEEQTETTEQRIAEEVTEVQAMHTSPEQSVIIDEPIQAQPESEEVGTGETISEALVEEVVTATSVDDHVTEDIIPVEQTGLAENVEPIVQAEPVQSVEQTIQEEIQQSEPHTQTEPAQESTSTYIEEPIQAPTQSQALIQSGDKEFDDLVLLLRQGPSKLSAWLKVILDGVEEADDRFWKRLGYLLKALETPEDEAKVFCHDFKTWLEKMDYFYLDDFRSELQYRLALALELEDEEDERDLLFSKVREGLTKTRNQLNKGLQNLFAGHDKLGEAFFEDLEELFIMSDMGTELSLKLVAKLREHARINKLENSKDILPYLQEEVRTLFRMPKRIVSVNAPEVVLMVGVNGVGKTTTIAKLAYRAKMQGKKVLIAGADTFRAAAVEQMETWAKRIDVDFYSKGSGADPAAVAYEAMDRAVQGGHDVIFIDTAGRLHNKSNLMDELQKIRNVLGKKHQGAPHRSILVIDATTGQNALQQTKVFKEFGGVDEIILTKLDGTAKGGVALAVASLFEVPITFIGLGEKMEDLRPFHADDFAEALIGDKVLQDSE